MAIDYSAYWDGLTPAQATEAFERHVATQRERAEAAALRFASLDVEAAVDFSRASLESVWTLALGHTQPVASPDLAPDQLPLWAAFRVGFAQEVGLGVVAMVTNLGAYFAEAALQLDIGCRWYLGDVPNQEGYQQPLLRFPAGAELAVENMVSNTLMRAVSGDGPAAAKSAAPDGLRRQMDMRAKLSAGDATSDAETFEVHHEHGASYHVTFADDVDNTVSERLDRLVDTLNSRFSASAIREDRDVLLAREWTHGEQALAGVCRLWY
ncbi:MAG: hypothetical protein AAFY28_03840 [Actinomycetota bacterium]